MASRKGKGQAVTGSNFRSNDVIDLSVPIDLEDERLNAAFDWAVDSLVARDINKADPRRADFEHILDCTFLMEDRDDFYWGNMQILLTAYFNFWFTIWMKSGERKHLRTLLDKALIQEALLIRFVRDDQLNPGESISDYLKRHTGETAIFERMLDGLYGYGKTYYDGDGWLLTAHSNYNEFYPVSIIQSLATLTAIGLAWTEEKVIRASDWCGVADASLFYSEADMYVATRYEAANQAGRVSAVPSKE